MILKEWKKEQVLKVHPKGIPENFELGLDECYIEYFDIPKPDDVVFLGWYDIGEVFRSGCTWTRGYGKIFFFQSDHETNYSYHNAYVREILKNAVFWATPENRKNQLTTTKIEKTLEEQRKQ